jgi:hypothetical protein
VWLYVAAKPSHMGVGVDGLAFPLHRPTAYNHQMRVHGLLPGAILLCHWSRRWRLSRDVKPIEIGYLVES